MFTSIRTLLTRISEVENLASYVDYNNVFFTIIQDNPFSVLTKDEEVVGFSLEKRIWE